jgi:hypothetical protein
MAATTVADATAAVEGFIKPYEAKFGGMNREREVVPVLAHILVLANRKRLTNNDLARLIDDDRGLRQMVDEGVDSTDEEERNAASPLQSWLERDDVYANMDRNMILSAASLAVRQEPLLG